MQEGYRSFKRVNPRLSAQGVMHRLRLRGRQMTYIIDFDITGRHTDPPALDIALVHSRRDEIRIRVLRGSDLTFV